MFLTLPPTLCTVGLMHNLARTHPTAEVPSEEVLSLIPDPSVHPTLDVAAAGGLLGLSRAKSYVEAHRYVRTEGREGLPTVAFGRSLRCPTAKILDLLGALPASQGDAS